MALDKLNSRRTCTEGIFQALHIEAHFFNTRVWRFFFQKLLEIKVFLIKACVTVFGIIMKMLKPLTSIFEAERPQERRFCLRNDSPDFLSSKCPYLIPSPQGNSNGIYPVISSTYAQGFGDHSISTAAPRWRVCVFTGHQGGERDSTQNMQRQRRCVGDEWRSAFQVWSVTAWGVFMAYSRLWCRLNKVSFPFTMTSSKTRPEGGEDESARPARLRREVAASLWKLWCWPWLLIPRPLPKTHLRGSIKSHWNFSAHAGGMGVPEMGLKLSHRGQARIEQVTVVLGQCFPKPRPMRTHLKMLQGETGLSHHGQLEASSAAPKVRHHLPPGGDMTQRQKVTDLLLYPGRDLIGLLRTGDCSCWIVQGATLWLDKYSSGGAKIYLPSSVQAHLLKTLAYISSSPSQWPSDMFFIFHVNILAH